MLNERWERGDKPKCYNGGEISKVQYYLLPVAGCDTVVADLSYHTMTYYFVLFVFRFPYEKNGCLLKYHPVLNLNLSIPTETLNTKRFAQSRIFLRHFPVFSDHNAGRGFSQSYVVILFRL